SQAGALASPPGYVEDERRISPDFILEIGEAATLVHDRKDALKLDSEGITELAPTVVDVSANGTRQHQGEVRRFGWGELGGYLAEVAARGLRDAIDPRPVLDGVEVEL